MKMTPDLHEALLSFSQQESESLGVKIGTVTLIENFLLRDSPAIRDKRREFARHYKKQQEKHPNAIINKSSEPN